MKSLSILLIDDDAIERMKFKKVCKDICFPGSIVEAINGKQALSFLNNKTNTFNFIILDLHMPEMNGLEFLEKIKSNFLLKNIPVIMMSNTDDINEQMKCYEFGVSGFFKKPAKYSKYFKKVKSLLRYWDQNEFID